MVPYHKAIASLLEEWTPYYAACNAVRAATRPGEDGKPLDVTEQAHWRKQAVAWLRADLDAIGKSLETARPEQRMSLRRFLQHWLQDTDLVGIRDRDGVEKLPAEEREACRLLWAEVERLLRKVGEDKL